MCWDQWAPFPLISEYCGFNSGWDVATVLSASFVPHQKFELHFWQASRIAAAVGDSPLNLS